MQKIFLHHQITLNYFYRIHLLPSQQIKMIKWVYKIGFIHFCLGEQVTVLFCYLITECHLGKSKILPVSKETQDKCDIEGIQTASCPIWWLPTRLDNFWWSLSFVLLNLLKSPLVLVPVRQACCWLLVIQMLPGVWHRHVSVAEKRKTNQIEYRKHVWSIWGKSAMTGLWNPTDKIKNYMCQFSQTYLHYLYSQQNITTTTCSFYTVSSCQGLVLNKGDATTPPQTNTCTHSAFWPTDYRFSAHLRTKFWAF